MATCGGSTYLRVSGVPAVTAKTKLHTAGAAHPLFASMATVHIGATQSYVFFGTGSDLLPSTGLPTTHRYKLISLLDQGTSGSVKFTELLQKIDGSGNDEKVTGFPAVAGDIVFFVTTVTKPANACTLPDGALFAMTFTGGKGYLADRLEQQRQRHPDARWCAGKRPVHRRPAPRVRLRKQAGDPGRPSGLQQRRRPGGRPYSVLA